MSDARITIAVSDPWHDSAYAVHVGSAIRHEEVERLTRRKYEVLDPLVALAHFEPVVLANAEQLLIVEGDKYAPFLRAAEAGDVKDTAALVDLVMAENASHLPKDADVAAVRAGLEAVVSRLVDGSLPYRIYNHHFCHAINAFLSSPFDRALSFSLDGCGLDWRDGRQDLIHGSVYEFDRTEPISDSPVSLVRSWSAGFAWDRACFPCGLGSHDAGTLMAMAAYGKRNFIAEHIVGSDLFWSSAIDESEFLRVKLIHLKDKILRRLARTEKGRFSIGHQIQRETERRIKSHLARFLDGRTDVNVCLSGGTFLNCVVAQQVRDWFPQVREVYLPPVPFDAGLPIGALQAWLHEQGVTKFFDGPFCPFFDDFQYSREDILETCASAGCNPTIDAGIEDVIDLLDRGLIVAQFQGSSESGRRALGNRSVLCDPRRDEHRLRLNSRIKKRQWFRPFAPMILAEHAHEWFELPAPFSSPYMSFAARFRDGMGARVPAVRHADDTARLQTVHAELTPGTHALLQAWKGRTGIPILLNTSFNENEPIVETPEQAVATFLRTRIDALYFADHGILLQTKVQQEPGAVA